MQNKKRIVIITFVFFSLVLLFTAGSYALFSYSGSGIITNMLTSDDIKFTYFEGNNTINLTEAIPISDEDGKIQTDYFEFDVAAKTSKNIEIPYDITLRKGLSSSNIDKAIKLYLTEVVPASEVVYTTYLIFYTDDSATCNFVKDNPGDYTECTTIYTSGDTIDHDIYTIRVVESYDNLEECNVSSSYNPFSNSDCVEDNGKYYLYYNLSLYDSREECLSILQNMSINSEGVQSSCELYHSANTKISSNIYKFEVYDETEYSTEKECTTKSSLPCIEKNTVNGERKLLLTTVDQLPLYSGNSKDNLLFSSVIGANSDKATKYRLRIWVDSDVDFTNFEFNDATFSSSLNVYAKGSLK